MNTDKYHTATLLDQSHVEDEGSDIAGRLLAALPREHLAGCGWEGLLTQRDLLL